MIQRARCEGNMEEKSEDGYSFFDSRGHSLNQSKMAWNGCYCEVASRFTRKLIAAGWGQLSTVRTHVVLSSCIWQRDLCHSEASAKGTTVNSCPTYGRVLMERCFSPTSTQIRFGGEKLLNKIAYKQSALDRFGLVTWWKIPLRASSLRFPRVDTCGVPENQPWTSAPCNLLLHQSSFFAAFSSFSSLSMISAFHIAYLNSAQALSGLEACLDMVILSASNCA